MKKLIAGAALIATLVGATTPALANTDDTQGTTEVTTQVGAEATTEVNAEATTQVDAEAKSGANTEASTEAETEAGTEGNTEVSIEAGTQAGTEVGTEVQTEGTAVGATDETAGAAEDTGAEADLPEVSLTADDFFYFLKLWIEKVRIAITRDAAAKAALLEEQARTRLAEAVKLAEEGKADLAQEAMREARAKLSEAGEQIKLAVKAGKDLTALAERIEADQVRYARAVKAILGKLPEEVQDEVEPLTADLLVQLTEDGDTAKQDEEVVEEAEKVAAESGLQEELSTLHPRKVLVLKAMAEAAGKDLAEVYALYKQNPGLGHIAKQLGLKMGPIQHAAQIQWKKRHDHDAKAKDAKPEGQPADRQSGSAPTAPAAYADDKKGFDRQQDRKQDRDQAKRHDKDGERSKSGSWDRQERKRDADDDDRDGRGHGSRQDESERKHPVFDGLRKIGQGVDKALGRGHGNR